MSDLTVPAYMDPENAGKKYHLKHVADGEYASRDDERWKIGDLQVAYRVVDPKVLDDDYTAIGVLTEDGVLKIDEDHGAFYHGIVTMDKANKDYQTDQLQLGFKFIGMGLLLIGMIVGIALIPQLHINNIIADMLRKN